MVFGFGEGKISVAEQLQDPESGLTPEVLDTATDLILHDKRLFRRVDIDAQDDGCGDGRAAGIVYRLVPQSPEVDVYERRMKLFNKSRLRAKVFGGGLVVASSMMRTAVWGAISDNDTVLADRQATVDLLQKHEVQFGGHTDTHASGEKCGCGAIDFYPEITAKAIKYRQNIEKVLQMVLSEDFADYRDEIDAVYEVYEDQITHHRDYFADADGNKTLQLLEESGSVIKQLQDDHQEDFVVINDVEDETFDQRALDLALQEAGIAGEAQAFVVDLWRIRMYADLVAAEGIELGLDEETTRKKAFVDGLIRTLATSAQLTAGDQRVFYRANR